MEFRIEKCAMFIKKMGNDTWRKDWNNQTRKKIKKIRENETLKYFRILEADNIKQVAMKEKRKI